MKHLRVQWSEATSLVMNHKELNVSRDAKLRSIIGAKIKLRGFKLRGLYMVHIGNGHTPREGQGASINTSNMP